MEPLKLPPGLLERITNFDPATVPARAEKPPRCPICKDAGFLRACRADGTRIWDGTTARIVPCRCKKEGAATRRRQSLEAIDGLTAHERTLRFELLERSANGPAIDGVAAAVAERRGLITLTGKPGTGKTTLLICAVNAAREQGRPAVYATMTDLLDYLRAAFDPQQEGDAHFAERWDLLVHAEVLAIDEIDEFHATGWAQERFLRLMDERWRRLEERLTLCATNAPLHVLPAKVASRLRDGRARLFTTSGPDLRPTARAEGPGVKVSCVPGAARV